jgi:hypothetical protein
MNDLALLRNDRVSQPERGQNLGCPGAGSDDHLVGLDLFVTPVADNGAAVFDFEDRKIVDECRAQRNGGPHHRGGEKPRVDSGAAGNVQGLETVAQGREQLLRLFGR